MVKNIQFTNFTKYSNMRVVEYHKNLTKIFKKTNFKEIYYEKI